MTATPSAPPLIAERADIHKSCKSIESLLSVLDDYSQVASAMATLEKKLAKAMRELTGQKITGEIAANACSVGANVFEASADISSKFAKIIDKEYDGIGTEVRKWFKKLAKEERAHDERLSSANARIKQAGQAYEKKSRKNTRDAAEDHARYINLISTLGPEMTKDKYEHGISMTRQHILTTYSVAACLARIADAEWLRACESIRRFSPNVGPLGEWRALCEGGWERPVPRELPDIDAAEPDQNLTEPRILKPPRHQQLERRGDIPNNPSSHPASTASLDNSAHSPLQSETTGAASSYAGHDSSMDIQNIHRSNNQTLNSSPLQPPRPLVDPNTGSVRSLSAFPAPPSHFPIPSPRPFGFQPTPSALNPNATIREVTSSTDGDAAEDSVRAETPTQDIPSTPSASASERGDIRSQSPESTRDTATSESTSKATELGGASGTTSNSYVAAMRHRYTNSSGANSPQLKEFPRLPTRVADLATRYQSPEPPASPTRPRRPSLLIRHQNNNASPAVRTDEPQYFQVETPQELNAIHNEQTQQHESRERQLLELERELQLKAREIERDREELDRVRRDITKVAPSGFSAFAQQLIPRSRERRISLRRQQQPPQLETPSLFGQQDSNESPSSSIQHSYHIAHSPSQLDPPPSSSSGAHQGHYPLQSRHSQQSLLSTPGLVSSSMNPASQPPSPRLTRPPNPGYNTRSSDQSPHRANIQSMEHPPYCGCERCSSKYSDPPNHTPDAHALRPPEQPIVLRPSTSHSSGGGVGGNEATRGKRPGAGTSRQQVPEKPKGGWMRRLSMPVVMGHALNLDSSSSKKNSQQRESSSSSSLYALGAGIGNTPLPNPGGLFSLDGRKNASSTNLRLGGGTVVREDGKLGGRRSYEANMLSNRSMTNLGQSGKR